MLYLAIRLGEYRYRTEEVLRRTGRRLLTISLEQRARELDERDGRTLRQQQVTHMLVQSAHKCLCRESLRQNLVETNQRSGVVAREEHIGHREVGVVVQHIERLRHLLVS